MSSNPIIFGQIAPSAPKTPVGGSTATAAVVAGIQIGSAIGSSLFGAHNKAVQNEAAVLNSAVPAFYSTLNSIVNAANAGLMTVAAAQAGVDGAVNNYNSAVSSIRKPGNGPDTVAKDWIVPNANTVKTLLGGNGGSVTVGTIPSHAGFSGVQSITFTYKPFAAKSTPALNPPAPSLPLGATGEPIGSTGVVSFSDQSSLGLQSAGVAATASPSVSTTPAYSPSAPTVSSGLDTGFSVASLGNGSSPLSEQSSVAIKSLPKLVLIGAAVVAALVAGMSFHRSR